MIHELREKGAEIFIRFHYLVLLVTCFSSIKVNSQICPAKNAILNFTQVLLEVEEVEKAYYYVYNIIEEGGDFNKPMFTKVDSSQVTIVNGLEFGRKYMWNVEVYDEKKELISKTESFSFSIGSSEFVDPNKVRFRILKDDRKHENSGLIFLDYSNVVIDRSGNPVWFLPEINGIDGGQKSRFRDLKMTSRGTITFNAAKVCREIALDGQLLWETQGEGAISNEDSDYYHHDFTRLKSGNYIVLAIAYRDKKLSLGNQSIDKVPVSVIVEYNQNHEVVWTWYSDEYITDEDMLEVGHKVFKGKTFGHMNSVYVDEDNDEVYAGFRDLNAIVLIDKKSNKILKSYGDKIPSDSSKHAIGFFKKQHAPVLMENGDIILYNNDEPSKEAESTVLILKDSGDIVSKKWEFGCDFDTIMSGFGSRMGNVHPIDNDHYLVNMGQVARLFEVTSNKTIIWDCLPETWDENNKKWRPHSNYRLAYTSSLYPYYFSFSMKGDTNSSPILFIVNEGTEFDIYTLKVTSPKRKNKVYYEEVLELEAGRSVRVPLNLIKDKHLKNGVNIIVSSKNNDLITRTKSYKF